MEATRIMVMPNAKPVDETEINRLIGQRLRQLRVVKGLSLEALGEKVGVTYQQIQKYELGLNIVSPGKLVALSRIFEVSVAEFVREPDSEEERLTINAGLMHVTRRLQIIQRERPIAFKAFQDIVRVLCNEIQGVRPTPRPHRRKRKA